MILLSGPASQVPRRSPRIRWFGWRSVVLIPVLLCVSGVGRGQVISQFPIPTSNSTPSGVATGPDGNLWFIELTADKIGRITTDGVITEFPIPTAECTPYGIAAGPDGNLWFTESSFSANKVGRITTDGVITEFSIPSA